ncbi:hypothetical protein ANCCAN_29782, partial [Ancylostoma caninum]
MKCRNQLVKGVLLWRYSILGRGDRKEGNQFIPETHLEQWTKMEPKGLISAYLQLSKSKLTMLVTSTAVAGVLMAPVSISAVPLAACAAGLNLEQYNFIFVFTSV